MGTLLSSSTPIVRQISWLATIPQFVALGLAVGIGMRLDQANGVFWGAAAYLCYSFGSRKLITRDQRAGVSLIKSQRFEEALPRFQKSLDFFDRHTWIDRFRSVVLMSPSAASYREMALANIAFCYGQLGDGKQSRHYYEECLRRFPNSGIALSALKMFEAAEQE